MAVRRQFGSIRKLPSKRFQARYTGPDGRMYSARTNGGWTTTFDTKSLAGAALAAEQTAIEKGTWKRPAKTGDAKPRGPVTVREYAEAWLAGRHLEESTRDHYRTLLDGHIYPALGRVAVVDLDPVKVREWYAKLATGDGKKVKDRPTARAQSYSLLKTILKTAVEEDGLIEANPCRIRGASQAKRAKTIRPAGLAELESIVRAVPARYRLLVLLAAWTALRFGELTELRRGDVDVKEGVLRVRRGVARAKWVKGPKSEAGKRDVHIPPHVIPMVTDHLRDHVGIHRDALLFPAARDAGKHMAHGTMQAVFYPARERAGRPDLRFHDLRHTGAVLAAATGATLAELMARLGHSSPAAALRYQHAAAERDKVIAEALSKLATVTPIDAPRKEGTA